MPRFFFHIRDSTDFPDQYGLILKDLTAAEQEAIRGARDIIAEEVRHGKLPLGERIDVEDEQGAVVTTVHFRDTVTIEE